MLGIIGGNDVIWLCGDAAMAYSCVLVVSAEAIMWRFSYLVKALCYFDCLIHPDDLIWLLITIISGIYRSCSGWNRRFRLCWTQPGSGRPVGQDRTTRSCSGRYRLQWLHNRPGHRAVLCWEDWRGHHPEEGPHPWVHPQEHWAVPLHIRHQVQAVPRRGLRRELREILSNHLQAEGI